MGVGYNLIRYRIEETLAGGSGNMNLSLTLTPPAVENGLWIKTEALPASIESVMEREIAPRFAESWETISLPAGYSSFAVVKDYLYLIGNADGTYAKAFLKDSNLNFTYHDSGYTGAFTGTAVIGSKIYAVKEGATLQVYEINTEDAIPTFTVILPELVSFSNPRICSSGSKLAALMGASTGSKLACYIDTAQEIPQWTALSSLTEDSSKSAVIALDGFMYSIGMVSTGYKCYGIEIDRSGAAWQIVTGFTSQGVYLPGLSDVGGVLRIVNCGYSVQERNCLSLINGIWQTSAQTGLTPLTAFISSLSRTYHTDYGLYVKDKNTNTIYLLRRSIPVLDYDDNTLLIVKGKDGKNAETAAVDKYTVRENVVACYLYNKAGGEQALTRLPVYWYNNQISDWEEIIYDF